MFAVAGLGAVNFLLSQTRPHVRRDMPASPHTSPCTPPHTHPHPHHTHTSPHTRNRTLFNSVTTRLSVASAVLPPSCVVCHHPHGYIASGPIAWMAPETFDGRMPSRTASTAGDVYMLGSTFLEVISGCTRTPFDWLPARGVFNYRGHEVSRQVNTVEAALEAGKPYTSAGAVCVDCPHCEAGTVYPGGSLRVD